MRVDAEIKTLGFEILTQHLGLVDAERFVVLIQREKFGNKTGEEISQQAMRHQKTKETNRPHVGW